MVSTGSATSARSGSLSRPCATSTRNPATPRSSQNRRISANIGRTRGSRQFQSGWLVSNRCRYHWPSGTRVQARPPNLEGQLFGGSSPWAPRPSRKMNRSRSGLPGAAASAFLNSGCSDEQWFGTRSTITRMPWSRAPRDQGVEVGEGAEPRVHVHVVADVVAAVVQRRRVERGQPDGVHAQAGQVPQAARNARQVADPVAVGVGEAARVDLVNNRVRPPRLVVHVHRGPFHL